MCVCFLLHLFVEFSDVWEFSESLFIFCFVFSCFLVLRGAYIYIYIYKVCIYVYYVYTHIRNARVYINMAINIDVYV